MSDPNLERFRSVFGVVREGLLVLDGEGLIRECNASAARLLELDVEEIVGTSARTSSRALFREDGSTLPREEHPALVTLRTGQPCDDVVLGKETAGVMQWLSFNSRLLEADADGKPSAVVVSFIDVTEQRTAREKAERAAFLARASEVLASTDYENSLQAFAELTVPLLGTWTFVDTLEGDEFVRRGVANVDPTKAHLAARLRRSYPKWPHAPGISRAMTAPMTVIVHPVDESFFAKVARDAEHLECLRAIGGTSCLIVPMIARGNVLGALTFGLTRADRTYTPSEISLAEELGKRVAVAIDNARLSRALAESEARFRGVADANIIGIVLGEDRTIFEANDCALQILGFTREDLKAGLIPVKSPESKEWSKENEESLKRVRAGGRATPYETEALRKDGSHIPVLVASGSLGGARWATFFLDRTEARRAAERAAFLAEATQALASSLDYAGTLKTIARLAVGRICEIAAVFRVTPRKDVELFAAAHKDPTKDTLVREIHEIASRSKNRPVLRVVLSGKPELHSELTAADIAQVSTNPRVAEIARELQLQSTMVLPLTVRGTVIGALVLSTGGRDAHAFTEEDFLVAIDLARRAGLTIENVQLYHEAQEANRVKDEFLATLSHELRTPLNAILGWAHMLQGEMASPASYDKGLATIERNARAQARIVEDLLDVSRITSGKLGLRRRVMDLRQAVKDAVDTMRPAAEVKGVILDGDAAPEVPVLVDGDSGRLQQVVWNLLSNAIKFTPAGGRVTVSLAGTPSAAEIIVRDTGNGVAAEFVPFLFERFRQADSSATRSQGGLGLGLALVRHIIELHGGSVLAASDGEGKGATFTVSLPSAQRDATEAAAPPPSSLPPRPTSDARLVGVRVLVVDDDPDARDLAGTILQEAGATVIVVASAAAAFADATKSAPDVIISDLAMPEEDGYSLLRKLRAEGATKSIPAVALTAAARPEDRRSALDAGFARFLPKPAEPEKLVRAVRELARRDGTSRA